MRLTAPCLTQVRLLWAVLTLVLALPPAARAATYYVRTNGNDAAVGTSWAALKLSIQGAVSCKYSDSGMCAAYWEVLLLLLLKNRPTRGFTRLVGAHVDLGAVEGAFNPAMPLSNPVRSGSGSIQFSFANLSGLPFTVFASTNAAAPLNTWSNLGPAVETPPGTYQFNDPGATNYPHRFYHVTSP